VQQWQYVDAALDCQGVMLQRTQNDERLEKAFGIKI
jgi:hypothetical protein